MKRTLDDADITVPDLDPGHRRTRARQLSPSAAIKRLGIGVGRRPARPSHWRTTHSSFFNTRRDAISIALEERRVLHRVLYPETHIGRKKVLLRRGIR